ncbi:MAG: HAD family hydrolase [Hyphomicrobiaceae bacterium]
MSLNDVRALTFDTGGTILDWHTGFATVLAEVGRTHGIERDWHGMANEMRRRSLKRMLNLGETEPPAYNFDGAHRAALEELIDESGLAAFTEEERHRISYQAPHNFQCWPDFPGVLPKLRNTYMCASFTILSFRIIMDTARRNGLSWDAVFSCEAIGKYKVLPEAYLTVAKYLQLEPGECCMVACHNFDLDAAKAQGFKTAFVRRPDEWGAEGPPDPEPNPSHDIIVDDFPALARALGVEA